MKLDKLASIHSGLKLVAVTGLLLMLNACASGDSTGWTKKASPWDRVRNEPAPAVKDAEPAAIELESVYTSEVMVEEPAIIEPMPVEVVEPVVAEVVADAQSAHIGNAIMQQPADYYTVQLMASVDLDRVYRFADQNQLSIKYIIPTQRDGVTWYVLLLDIYPDQAAAIAGKQEVEATLNTSPWVRRVGTLQKLVQP